MVMTALRTGDVRRLVPIPVTTRQNKELVFQNLENELEKVVTELDKDSHTRMTFWSRYDPVSQPRGNTDHWTKMKQRAVQFKSLDNNGTLGFPVTLDALEGAVPGSYMYTRPRNSVSRESTRNAFNERARDGFRYWLIERPKPTSFGKYGIGSYKTVLGVGNAPRT